MRPAYCGMSKACGAASATVQRVSGDDARRLALSLPEAEERETWGHPTFRVRDKMFMAMAGLVEEARRMTAPRRLVRAFEDA